MPILDMPLDELKSYQGRNPRPHDFDAYWQKALAELATIDPKIELTDGPKLAPYARCQNLTWTGLGGARVYTKLLTPTNASGKGPGLVQFHGYSMNSGDWSGYLGYVAAGFTVAAMDVRGQGGLSEDVGGVKGNTLRGHIIRGLDAGPEHLLYRSIYMDTVQLARIVMGLDTVDGSKVSVTGWSQGGGLTLACAGLEPRIHRAVPVYPFLSDYKRVWEMDMAKHAFEEIAQYFKRFDPLHEREEEFWETLGYIDVQHLAPRIKAETLMVTGLMDDVCMPSIQFAAYNKISAPKQMLIYPDFGHEGLPGASDRIFQFLNRP